jgi:hypothetical protein
MMDQKDMDIEKETVAYVVKRDTIAGNVRIRIKIITWIRRRRTRTMWQSKGSGGKNETINATHR